MTNSRMGNEYIEAKEDEIARMITAINQAELLRELIIIMNRKGDITDAEFTESVEAIDGIIQALQAGKKATAMLRNRTA